MSDELTKIDYSNREVIDTIKKTVAKDATDAQLAQFLHVCKATGLNPFLKEVWCIAKTNTIMASRDGYLRIANEHPQFDGMSTTVERDAKNVPVKATCTVYRKDRSHPIVCEAYYNEYRKDSNVWSQYPSAMISKVAEVLALKRSFAINGVVTEEEIGTETPKPRHVVQVKPAELPPMPSEETLTKEEYEEAFSDAIAEDDFPPPHASLPSKPLFDENLILKNMAKNIAKKVQAADPLRTIDQTVAFLMNAPKAKYEHIDQVSSPEKLKKLEVLIEFGNKWLKAHEDNQKAKEASA